MAKDVNTGRGNESRPLMLQNITNLLATWGETIIKIKHTWGFARQLACWEQCRCSNHTSIPKAPEECLSHTVHLKVLDEIVNNYSVIQRQTSLTRGSFQVGMLGSSFQFSAASKVRRDRQRVKVSKANTGKSASIFALDSINIHCLASISKN